MTFLYSWFYKDTYEVIDSTPEIPSKSTITYGLSESSSKNSIIPAYENKKCTNCLYISGISAIVLSSVIILYLKKRN